MDRLLTDKRAVNIRGGGEVLDLTGGSAVIDLTDASDEIDPMQIGFRHRHPSLAWNILGIHYLAPVVFGEDQTLRQAALNMEEDRGEQGFSPNAVHTVYDTEGNLSLSALRQLVAHHYAWEALHPSR